MEEREFRLEMERIETDKRMSYRIVDDMGSSLAKKMDTKLREAIMETKQELYESILKRYNVERKVLNDRRERERRRR